MLRSLLAATIVVLLGCGGPPANEPGTAPGTAPPPTGQPVARAPQLDIGGSAWVAVSVATVWRSPEVVRAVDRPATTRPVRVRRWLAAMTLEQRRDLAGRADTQALLGDRVRVVDLAGGWARVRVAGQPNPGDRGGYDGWVPRRQLSARAPVRTEEVATVVRRTARLRSDDPSALHRAEVSVGTRLGFVGEVGDDVRVLLPGGGDRLVRADHVVVHPRGSPALPRTGRAVAATARRFAGIDYLWAGRSGFGLDCSGLTSLAYRLHGRVLPRDAAPQSRTGRPVASRDWRRGDLLFYATAGTVHHVAMYVGHGRMVHAPRTGVPVEVVPVLSDGYAASRRYLG